MRNQIKHSGRKGQKWYVRNGPPYPLGADQLSSVERKNGGVSKSAKERDGSKRLDSTKSKENDIREIARSLSKDELSKITWGRTYQLAKDSVYSKVEYVNNSPAAFIEMYRDKGYKRNQVSVNIATKPEYRGQGLAKKLVKSALREMPSYIEEVYWETDIWNKPSSSIAKSFGFKKAEDYWGDDDNYMLDLTKVKHSAKEKDTFKHSGRRGQRWYVKNGPPYPLGADQLSSVERKNGGVSKSAKERDKNKEPGSSRKSNSVIGRKIKNAINNKIAKKKQERELEKQNKKNAKDAALRKKMIRDALEKDYSGFSDRDLKKAIDRLKLEDDYRRALGNTPEGRQIREENYKKGAVKKFAKQIGKDVLDVGRDVGKQYMKQTLRDALGLKDDKGKKNKKGKNNNNNNNNNNNGNKNNKSTLDETREREKTIRKRDKQKYKVRMKELKDKQKNKDREWKKRNQSDSRVKFSKQFKEAYRKTKKK